MNLRNTFVWNALIGVSTIIILITIYNYYGLYSKNKVYWDKYAHACRFDPAEIIYFKRMLQKVLPFKLRNNLVENIFKNVCNSSVKDFAKE